MVEPHTSPTSFKDPKTPILDTSFSVDTKTRELFGEMKRPLHKLNGVFDGLRGRTTQMTSLAGLLGTNLEIADLPQRLSDQDQKHNNVITEVHGIVDEVELLQSQYVANIRKEVERGIAEQMVQEPVAGCLKTHIPQDEVGKSNRESSHLPGSQLPDTGLPMSPRNQPSALQGPSTPTLFPTIACTSDIRRPGPLDVTSAIRSASSVVASLAAARFIADITTLSYPEGYQGPHPDLNQNVKNGKFRYDREFLLQFMSVCKERPAALPPLDAIGLKPVDHTLAMRRGGSALRPSGASNLFSMGNFATMRVGSRLSSDERYANNNLASVSGAPGMQFARIWPSTINQMQILDAFAPLQASENRWDRNAIQVDQDSPEMVERKVKGLLNKLTMEKYASISDQIIAWANKSEKETDGRTIIQVIRLVSEKATEKTAWSEMYARLCMKMMEQISSNVQIDGISDPEGKPITGGQLFRKYLINRCQEDFESGWVAKEATAAAAAAAEELEDEAAKAKTMEGGTEKIYSDEYYAAQKIKRQRLGLIKFIGELFKLRMITELVIHECVKKFLVKDNPEEEEIESLCMLLVTVGSTLDISRGRGHLNVYFSRMEELMKSPNVTTRMQYMLQDLLELRQRKWVARNAQQPVTFPPIIAQMKESYQRQIGMSQGGSRFGGDRDEFNNSSQVGPDGWTVYGSGPLRLPPKAGDLSNFGKISKN